MVDDRESRQPHPDLLQSMVPPRMSASVVKNSNQRVLFRRLHQSRWYAFLPSDSPSGDFETGLSANTDVRILPAANITEMLGSLEAGWVGGIALLIDQPFPLLHVHQGHWLETVIPLWESVGRRQKHFTGNVVLWGSRASSLSDWMNATLSVALTPIEKKQGGPENSLKFDFIDSKALEKIPSNLWIGFEKLMVIRDRYTHPQAKNGFLAQGHGNAWNRDGCQRFVRNDIEVGFEEEVSAREFSSAAFQSQTLAVQHPSQSTGLPKTITVISSFNSQEAIENMDAVLGMLWRVARSIGWRVRPFMVDSHTPFSSFLAVMRRTGLLVGRHSHLLSNAIFLPPGGALFEFIPYNVEWGGVTLLNRNLSLSADQLGYSAWRADDPRWAVYRNRQDANYKGWTAGQCQSRECLAAHERAGLVVDIATVEKKLRDFIEKHMKP
ncbi:hypothetical protein BSKO_08384 [Bryopsis sp. KO-2023]|nr:hypothetical protein BSKO_08384 [Bryopsis sp. KO-2023]